MDFDAQTITVRNGKAKRTDLIPMHPQLADELMRRRDTSMATPKARVFPQTVTDRTRLHDFLRAGLAREVVVTDADGKPVMIGKGKRQRPKIRIVTEDADGRCVDLHAMRTTLGTNLARAGVAPQIAQRIMRHSDYKTTLKHYTVLGLTDTSKAVADLPAIGTADVEVAATGTDANSPASSNTSSSAIGRERTRRSAAGSPADRRTPAGASLCQSLPNANARDQNRPRASKRVKGIEPSTTSLGS